MFLGEIYTSSSSDDEDADADAGARRGSLEAAETHRRMLDSWRRILRDGADADEISQITRYVQIPMETPTLAGPRLNPELRAVCEDDLAHIQHQLGKAVAMLSKIIRERAHPKDPGASRNLRNAKNGGPGGAKDLGETKTKELSGSKSLGEANSKDLGVFKETTEVKVDNKEPGETRRLEDAVKLLVDVQHKLSVHRRELIYAQLGEADLRSSCRDSPVDEVLFDRAAVKRCCKGTGVRLSGVDFNH